MTREIKFRAWDKENKIMRYSTSNFQIYTDSPTTGFVFWTDGYHQDWDSEEVELMQYTGLKDKNGNEIYEGDIVKNREWTGSVEFDPNEGYFFTDKTDKLRYRINSFTEIIGNIYENPELLK